MSGLFRLPFGFGRRKSPKLALARGIPDSVWMGMLCLALAGGIVHYIDGFVVSAASSGFWQGNVKFLATSMKALISVVRMVSAMLAVMMGAWVAIKWKHAGQQAQGDLINYLVMLVFMFGATLFIDAIIAVTVGKFAYLSSGGLPQNESTNFEFSFGTLPSAGGPGSN